MLRVELRASSTTREVEFDAVPPLLAVADTDTVSVIDPVLRAVCVTVQLPVHVIDTPGAMVEPSAGVQLVLRRGSVSTKLDSE